MAASTVAPVLIHVIDQDWRHVLDVAHQVVRFNVDPSDPAFAYNCDRERQQRGVSLV